MHSRGHSAAVLALAHLLPSFLGVSLSLFVDKWGSSCLLALLAHCLLVSSYYSFKSISFLLCTSWLVTERKDILGEKKEREEEKKLARDRTGMLNE